MYEGELTLQASGADQARAGIPRVYQPFGDERAFVVASHSSKSEAAEEVTCKVLEWLKPRFALTVACSRGKERAGRGCPQ